METGLAPPNWLRETGHRRQKGGQDDTRRAAVDGHHSGEERDDSGHRVLRRDSGQEVCEQRQPLRLLEKSDEDGYATDHDDDVPWNLPDGFRVIGGAVRVLVIPRRANAPMPTLILKKDDAGEEAEDARA